MNILYTNGATIRATIPEFQAYTQIRYAPTDGETMVSLVVTTSEWIMLGGALGTQSAKVQFTGETHGWTGDGNDSLLGDAARQWLAAGGGMTAFMGLPAPTF